MEKANKIKGHSMCPLIFKNIIACALFAQAFLFLLSPFAVEQLFRQSEACREKIFSARLVKCLPCGKYEMINYSPL